MLEKTANRICIGEERLPTIVRRRRSIPICYEVMSRVTAFAFAY